MNDRSFPTVFDIAVNDDRAKSIGGVHFRDEGLICSYVETMSSENGQKRRRVVAD